MCVEVWTCVYLHMGPALTSYVFLGYSPPYSLRLGQWTQSSLVWIVQLADLFWGIPFSLLSQSWNDIQGVIPTWHSCGWILLFIHVGQVLYLWNIWSSMHASIAGGVCEDSHMTFWISVHPPFVIHIHSLALNLLSKVDQLASKSQRYLRLPSAYLAVLHTS